MALAVSESMKTQRLSILVLVGFVLITLNLFRMQVLKGAYYRSLSEKNRIRVISARDMSRKERRTYAKEIHKA